MPGFSLTLLLLPFADESSAQNTDTLLSLLDQRPDAPGWKWSSGAPPSAKLAEQDSTVPSVATRSASTLSAPDPSLFTDAITRACYALIANEPEITRMDTIAGDGDCGLTLKASTSNCCSHQAPDRLWIFTGRRRRSATHLY